MGSTEHVPCVVQNLEDVTKEIAELQAALEAGKASYTLQYSVKCKQNLFRTMED